MKMQKSYLWFLTLFLLAGVAFGAPAANAAANPYADETLAQRDARMQWWREARFGLFIHWGVYAVPAGNLRGQQVPHDGAWLMDIRGVSTAEYMAFARQFEVFLGQQKLARTAMNTGNYETFQTVTLDGELEIAAPGNELLTVKPVAEGWVPMNLERLDLVRIE